MKKLKNLLLYIFITLLILGISFVMYEAITIDKEYYISEKNLQIPILAYHHLVENENEIQDDCMQTTVEKFKEQILGLMKWGYEPITYEELDEYSKGNLAISKWSFIITFDDGYEDFYTMVYPIAREYNIPITVFVIDNCMNQPGYLTWDQAKEMEQSGIISVYSHGLSHIENDKISSDDLLANLNTAYSNLQVKTGKKNTVKVFAYPYGLYNNEECEVLKEAGYIQNLMDNRVNLSNTLELSGLHRFYPLNDSTLKIILKQQYRVIKYK